MYQLKHSLKPISSKYVNNIITQQSKFKGSLCQWPSLHLNNNNHQSNGAFTSVLLSSAQCNTVLSRFYSTRATLHTAKDESIDPRQKPLLTFKDDYGVERKDKNEWDHEPKVTDYANQLLTIDEELLNEDVTLFHMDTSLQETEKKDPKIFVTSSAKTVWKFVLEHCESEEDTHAVVTGNPGIGKSRSMAYLLKLLLQKGKLVIYESRKDGKFYAFVPQQTDDSGNIQYECFSSPMKYFDETACAALRNPENYFLIDPKIVQAEDNVVAHTIIAASPNEERYKELLKQANGRAILFFIPPWTLDELTAVREYMPVDGQPLTLDMLDDRYTIVGGIPRLIFQKGAFFKITRDKIDEALDTLKFSKIVSLLNQETTGGDQAGRNRVSSLLFVDKLDGELKENSEKYWYSNRIKTVSSDFVNLKIMLKWYQKVMHIMNPKVKRKTSLNDSALGFFLESIAQSILYIGGTFPTKNLSNGKSEYLTIARASEHEEAKSWTQLAKKLANLPDVSDHSENRVLLTGATSQPAIDAADAVDRAFQVTKNADHPPLKGMQLCRMLEKAPPPSSSKPFKIYFMVPEYMFGAFKKQPITWKPIEDFTPQMKSKDELEELIEQHALCMPTKVESKSIEEILKKMRDMHPNIVPRVQ